MLTMHSNMSEQSILQSKKSSFSLRRIFKSDKHSAKDPGGQSQSGKLRKKNLPAPVSSQANDLGERHEYAIFNDNPSNEYSRPQIKDSGDVMHGLAHRDFLHDDDDEPPPKDHFSPNARRRKRQGMLVSPEHEKRIASLPPEVWKRIALFLNPIDAVNLAISNKTLYTKLGLMPFEMFNSIEHRHFKHAFLHALDEQYPGHLLCFPCSKYHKRLHPGKETLKIEYVNNPIFACPNINSSVLPRMRLTHARELPYAYIQLVLRAAKHTPSYGISIDALSKRWRHAGWTHRTRFLIHDGRLLMRVISRAFTLPARDMTETSMRHILYDREEYMPFFSVCAHWRDGLLMPTCKCMMSHVPAPPESIYQQLQKAPTFSRERANPGLIVRGCDTCRPARRCPECPTEYLVEINMVEDPSDPVQKFKHAIVVTRWSDLGDGRSPYTSPEWVAINGLESQERFDSFSHYGRRAVGGVFESKVSGQVPAMRLLSLNPKNVKKGEEGDGWY
ncbi:hypothetical protein EJ05DRAFT_479280 [Pseudovirgaria hyperparasitica]|uniref:F-box domain-containing protein n=1 Tax=Pseudovirgaria hyperparasitica TaxID=470096 RepID=A0A6A6W1E4_9PEZI|nr:uncharacterized protein EJ05DRAFT_479280 [Pseudovirgaria hyperparasitica]KAF2754871.1 hypothetical protein EJ05DRAFT_479280 [Pseudovirgaria hyperparasitica]